MKSHMSGYDADALRRLAAGLIAAVVLFTAGCSGKNPPSATPAKLPPGPSIVDNYVIGPGDNLDVFVWRNPELSVQVPVRPEGKISTPLVEDMVAAGKTPTELARDMEKVLAKFIKSPVVTIIVSDFKGTFDRQIRVVGEASQPQSLAYRENMTLLDLMIEVGGLTEFAAGNRAKLIRRTGGKEKTINVKLADLLKDGDIGANVKLRPGDILIIPESWF